MIPTSIAIQSWPSFRIHWPQRPVFGLWPTVMLALPPDSEADRHQWLGTLEKEARGVFVEGPLLGVYVVLSCRAPDESLASRIREEVEVYCYQSLTGPLVPPWDPGRQVTNPARGSRYLARKTFMKLEMAWFEQDAGCVELDEETVKASRAGDVDAVNRITSAQRRAACDLIRQAGEPFDDEVVELCESVPSLGMAAESDPAALRAVGRTELDDERQYGAQSDRIEQNGLQLRFRSLWFAQTFQGAEALCQWLCTLGCEDIMYRLEAIHVDY